MSCLSGIVFTFKANTPFLKGRLLSAVEINQNLQSAFPLHGTEQKAVTVHFCNIKQLMVLNTKTVNWMFIFRYAHPQ